MFDSLQDFQSGLEIFEGLKLVVAYSDFIPDGKTYFPEGCFSKEIFKSLQ